MRFTLQGVILILLAIGFVLWGIGNVQKGRLHEGRTALCKEMKSKYTGHFSGKYTITNQGILLCKANLEGVWYKYTNAEIKEKGVHQ